MATTDYGTISQRTAAWAATKMLEHAEPILVLSKFGDSKPQPKNKAEAVKFRRPVPFAPALTPLVEGVTPTAQAMAYEDVPATLDQWGAVVEITDKVADLAEDPVLSDASMLCGEQAAETIEAVTWGVLKGATNVFYANGSAVGDVNTAISKDKLRAVVRALQTQRAKPITRMLDSSPGHKTTPIEGGYVAFAHTDMASDIRDLAGFVPVAQYGSRNPLCPEELGTVENVRFILSPLLTPALNAGSSTANGMKVETTKVDIYDLVVVGMHSYGLVPLKGASAIKPSVINPNTPSKSDPLGQRGYVGWKAWYTALVLNQAWIARVRCGVKAL
ncbi:MAG: N4-gp56 family major capsid protein [Thauera sp.]|jgi:N4-gp56 family major capsid protein|nr:N4-gp56 family major capsid protein [Thauera sp.]